MIKTELKLADQKERGDIIHAAGHCFVSAGAGTGKSTTLVRKIVHLLRSGQLTSLSQMAAITFTNKAAMELRWKLEDELLAGVENSSSDEERALFQAALAEVSASLVGTIHSFCAHFLRRFPERVGVDPNFRIMDAENVKPLMTEVLRRYWSDQLRTARADDEPYQLWQEILSLEPGLELEAATNRLYILHEKNFLLEDIDPERFTIMSRADMKQHQDGLFAEYQRRFAEYARFYQAAEEVRDVGEDSLGGFILRTAGILETCQTWQQMQLCAFLLPTKHKRGRDKYFVAHPHYSAGQLRSIIAGCIKFFARGKFDLADDVVEAFASELLPGHTISDMSAIRREYLRYLWYRVGFAFDEHFRQYKCRQQLMDYQDLLVYMRHLVEDEVTRRRMRQELRYLFVDEYQDTDPLQTEIFRILTGFDDVEARDAITLFRVGDEKQSIYRFRGADLDTYRQQKEIFTQHDLGLLSDLRVNLRSHHRVLDFVNFVFSAAEAESGLSIADYDALEAQPDLVFKSAQKGVFFPFIDVTSEDRLHSRDRRLAEARLLATEVKACIEEGNLTVAMLFRSLSQIDDYLLALRELGVDYNVLGRRFYSENYPLRQLEFLLGVLLNPFDQISLAGLLRCGMVGFNDAEITDIARDGGLASAFERARRAEERSDRLGRLARDVDELRHLWHCSGLVSLLHAIFARFPFIESASCLADANAARAGLLRIIELAQGIDNSAASFNRREALQALLAASRKLNGIIEETHLSDELIRHNIGTVEIMSLHKAKGLEFDVVFLPDLARADFYGRSDLAIDYNDDINYISFAGALHDHTADIEMAAREVNKRREKAERTRLLYVGMTRAKERLYLPMLYQQGEAAFSDSSIAGDLQKRLTELGLPPHEVAELEGDWQLLAGDNVECHVRCHKVDLVREANMPVHAGKRGAGNWQANWPQWRAVQFFSGSSLRSNPELRDRILSHLDAAAGGESEGESRGQYIRSRFQTALAASSRGKLPATLKGIFVHLVFEWLDLQDPAWTPRLHEVLEHAYALKRYPDAWQQLRPIADDAIAVYRSSKLFSMMANAQILGREIPFSQRYQLATVAQDVPAGDQFELFTGEAAVDPVDGDDRLAVGYIDLAFRAADGVIWVVDYKTNEGSGARFAKQLLEDNRPAMELYRQAVSQFYDQTEVEIALYHTPSGELWRYQ